MKVEIRHSFIKDSRKLPTQNQIRLAELIEKIDFVKSIFEIPHCKKMQGYKNAYRIKLGDYRIGFFYLKDSIELVRIQLRKEIYRNFP